MKKILDLVPIRYEERMEDCAGFPHEIDLLLSYPVKDATKFIKDNGKNFLHMGYRKACSNLSECKRMFQSYDHAHKHIIHIASRGIKTGVILGIYNLNQYKPMTI